MKDQDKINLFSFLFTILILKATWYQIARKTQTNNIKNKVVIYSLHYTFHLVAVNNAQ